ncbi:MAG: general secretion pathway protein GspK [Verrucomicrobia bacterium]|nr:general secretion pathway protein GspK [Verrucomicrobiota bacterium]
MTPSRQHRRASVLVIVMVTLLFTAFALILFVEQASTDLLVEARAATAHRLRREAYSALEATLATLEEFRRADSGLHGPAEGWADPLAFAGWQPREGCTAEVALEDESGKLPLSRVDNGTLVSLFKSWDFNQADAERLADALLGWMRRDYVPSSGRSPDYDLGELPFEAPQRPIRSWTELAAIDYVRDIFYDEQGRPNDLYRRFTAAFSLYDYDQFNVNTASTDVLTAVGFSDPTQHGRLHDFLTGTGGYTAQGPGWLTSSSQAAGVLGTGAMPNLAGTQVRALRVTVTIHEGKSEFRLAAVVAPNGGAKIVKTTATDTREPTSAQGTAATGATAAARTATANAATPAAATAAAGGTKPQLNYPFTLLEIRENGEIPPPPPTSSPTPPPA